MRNSAKALDHCKTENVMCIAITDIKHVTNHTLHIKTPRILLKARSAIFIHQNNVLPV